MEPVEEPAKPNYADALKVAQDFAAEKGLDVANAAQPVTETDAALFARITSILDPKSVGPVLITTPIRGKVFVLTIPPWATTLSMQAHVDTQIAARGGSTLAELMDIAGALLAAAWGWYPVSDVNSITCVRANITDQSKWPEPRKLDWLTSKDPRLTNEVVALWEQFVKWKNSVEPTEEQLGKYYATGG